MNHDIGWITLSSVVRARKANGDRRSSDDVVSELEEYWRAGCRLALLEAAAEVAEDACA